VSDHSTNQVLTHSSLTHNLLSCHAVRLTPDLESANQTNKVIRTNPSSSELYMKSGQGFLLVFSITSSSSLKELSELRDQLVNLKDDPQVPIVLVGNKSDLEEDRAVSRAAAFAVSSGWGNVPYYEASARTRQNVSEVFVDVCRQIMHKDLQNGRGVGGNGGEERSRRRRDDDGVEGGEKKKGRRRNKCIIL
jgi:Ras-related protein Rap-1B